MYHYRITHEKRCLDGKIYHAYGIAVDSEESDGALVQEIARIDDIAVSAETLRHLVELCSRLELRPSTYPRSSMILSSRLKIIV